MKKIIIICICASALLLVGCNTKTSQEEKLIQENKELSERYELLQNDYNLLLKNYNDLKNPEIPSIEDKTCQNTQTYRVLHVMNGYQDDTDTVVYVIVNVFQNQFPLVLEVPKGMEKSLEENQTYEFTFEGKKSILLHQNFPVRGYKVIKIAKTDKVGFDQEPSTTCQ